MICVCTCCWLCQFVYVSFVKHGPSRALIPISAELVWSISTLFYLVPWTWGLHMIASNIFKSSSPSHARNSGNSGIQIGRNGFRGIEYFLGKSIVLFNLRNQYFLGKLGRSRKTIIELIRKPGFASISSY